MRRIPPVLAAALFAAGFAGASPAAETVHLYAPYAYGLLGSATCEKGDQDRLKALLVKFAAAAGATGQASRDDAKAFCAAMTKTFPVKAEHIDAILTQADKAGDGAPQPMADDGKGVRVEEIEISFLGLKVKVKFGPKKPADSDGHTGGGEGEGEGEGENQGGDDQPAEPQK